MTSKNEKRERRADGEARFFETPADFRAWLAKHHRTADELLVGFYTKSSGKPSITWPESVDEALCAGWIDGIRRRIDDESYSIRFTPRREGSIWSLINTKRVAVLTGVYSGLGVFQRPGRLLQAPCGALGDEREAGGDAPAPSGRADRVR